MLYKCNKCDGTGGLLYYISTRSKCMCSHKLNVKAKCSLNKNIYFCSEHFGPCDKCNGFGKVDWIQNILDN